jgi:phosphate:Na+ symporter
MILVAASLVAGLGLFFVGLYFLTEHLKMLSGRRLRERIATWTKQPLLGVMWGGVFIAITQSTAATMFIIISMMRSGMMTVRQALPMIIGVNMAAGVIVLILVVDIKVAILFLLGVAGIVFTNDKARAYRAIAGALFGISLLFFGLNTMQEGVAPLSQMAWFEGLLEWTKGNYLLGFAIGAVLSFFVQSSIAVVVLTIAFQKAGLFSLAESIMVVYGANVGSSFLALVLSASLAGQSKQIAMYQTAYNFIGAIILLPLFYVEVFEGVPLVRTFTEWIAADDGGQIATVNLIFNALPGVFLFVLLGVSARLLARVWPETLEEQASKPKYLHDHAAEDPDSAVDLIELEQVRLIEFISTSFDTQRKSGDKSKLAAFQEASKTLGGTIREAISDMSTRHQLTPEAYERLNVLLNLQHSLEAANEAIGGLADEFQALRQSQYGARFVRSAVEGLDTIVLTLINVAKERSKDDSDLLSTMTSEDGNGIKGVRSAYLAEESGLDATERMQLLAATNHCERLIWLFGEMGRDYMAFKAQ